MSMYYGFLLVTWLLKEMILYSVGGAGAGFVCKVIGESGCNADNHLDYSKRIHAHDTHIIRIVNRLETIFLNETAAQLSL